MSGETATNATVVQLSEPERSFPRRPRASPRHARRVGLALTGLGLPVLTAVLIEVRDQIALDSILLLYLLCVVVVAVVGGVLPAAVAAVISFLLANFFLTPPFHTLVVGQRDEVITLALFVVAVVRVSLTVEVGARNRAAICVCRAGRHRRSPSW